MATAGAQQKLSVVFFSKEVREGQPQENEQETKKRYHDQVLRLQQNDQLLVRAVLEGGSEILVMNTASTQKAREWISAGDFKESKHFKVEVLPCTFRHNNGCATKENMERESLTFIRYNTHITKFNVREAPTLFRDHDEYLSKLSKTGNVICEGLFSDDDGGIMIMKGEVDPAVIMADPAVANGIIEPIIKKMWVAYGSPCKLG